MRKRSLAGVLAIAALLPQVGSASAHPGEASHIETLNASVGSTTVSVTGSASFVSIPTTVNEDGTGDALVTGIGADISSATMSRPTTGTGNSVYFTLNIADPIQELNAIPHAVAYLWVFSVENSDGSFQDYELHAQRSGQASTNPTFNVYTCAIDPTTGVNTCSGGAVNGRFVAGAVEWQVPLSRFGGSTGKIIYPGGDGIQVLASAGGVVWGGPILEDAYQEVEYVIPGKSVRIGIAPAGTPPETVTLDRTATVNSAGGFTHSMPKPAQAGSYVVVAEACYGSDNCGLSSTTITV